MTAQSTLRRPSLSASEPTQAEPDAREVNHREHADHRLAHVVGLGQQAVADVVEQGDEAAHQQEADQEQPGQSGVAEVQAVAVEQGRRLQRCRPEVFRFGQHAPEHQRGDQGQAAEDRQCGMPGDEIDQDAADQASAHPADGVAANVQAHRQADVLRMDLFAEIGHRHRGQAAQGQPDQRAHQQHAMPGGHHRAAEGEQRGGQQRDDHHRLATDRVGDRAGDQQAKGEHGGGDGQCQAAFRGADGKRLGQHRHHRLDAVEQGKGGETAGEQRQRGAHELRGAFFDIAFDFGGGFQHLVGCFAGRLD